MAPAALALPSGLFRLQCHLKSLLLPSSIPTIKAFSSSLALDTDETPAMKALKDIPYPSASLDPSIFEPWSDEYDGVSLPRSMLARKPMASPRRADYYASHVLEQLSRSGRFEEAEQVLQELAKMNVPIRQSYAYHNVALNVLRQRPWPRNRVEIFTKWLSHLPDKANDGEYNLLAELSSALLSDSRYLDLKAVAQFGIVLSSKGYIRKMGASVVACLTRYADPEISSRVLVEMITANDHHSQTKPGTAHNAASPRKDKRTIRRLWSIAVRTHCTAGRPEVALQMAKIAHEHDFQLTKYTYEYLLGKLEADGLYGLAAELRALPWCGSLDVAKSRLVVNIPSLASIPPISRERNILVNQAIALAMLKRCSRSGVPVYASDLEPYFDIYKNHPRAANILRSRAYQLSPTAASAVLLAEQLHYHRRGQFRHVLWVFENFFHLVGVPSKDFTRQLWERKDYPPHLHTHPSHIPPRITETTYNFPSKIWPTPYHTALVWSALVHLSQTEEEIFALYDSLLQHSAQFQETTVDHHHHPSHGSSNGRIPAPVPAPADRFHGAHFHTFLIAFTHLRDAKYGLRVLDDMQDRGIAPSAQILSIAAALQARDGEPALALRMLDVVRELLERDEDEEADAELMGAGPVQVRVRLEKGVKKQEQMLIAYTGVLRGFIDRRYMVHARRVAGLLHSHLGYVEGRGCSDGGEVDGESGGGSARTDAVLRYLHRLEVEGPNAIPESFTDPEVDADYFYPFLKKPDRVVEVCPPQNFFTNRIVRVSHARALFLSPWG
jgi:hypothetical protein